MNHMNEILQLLDNIIVCSENMTKIGRVLKQLLPEMVEALPEKPVAIEATDVATAPAESLEKSEHAKTYNFADVRKAFATKSHAGYTAQVKELIKKYDADRLSDVKETDYPALMADLEVIG